MPLSIMPHMVLRRFTDVTPELLHTMDIHLLLDLSFQSRLADIAVLASVKAGFKVGKASQWGQVVNDLSLDLGDSGNPLDEILRLLESYLPYIGITQDRLPQGMEAGKEDLNRKGAGAGKPGRGLSK